MKSIGRYLLASMALIAILGSSARAAQRDAKDLAAQLLQAGEAYDAKDCAKTLKLAQPVIDGETAALPRELIAIGYDMVIACEAQTGKIIEANAHAMAVTAREYASDFSWRMRLVVALEQSRYADAVETVEAMNQSRRAALNSSPPEWLWQLVQLLSKDGLNELETRLLKVMADPSYQPDDAMHVNEGGNSMAHALYAQKLVAMGKGDAARSLITDLTSFGSASEVLFTPELRALLPSAPDLRAVVEKELVRHKAFAAANPNMLSPIMAVALDLRRLGRPDEALTILETARRHIADPDYFTDRADQLPWWWNSLGYTHKTLGQYDAMLDSFAKATVLLEKGGLNVSQVINLASEQLAFGRYNEAIKTLAVFDDKKHSISAYGAMQILSARGCSYAMLGDMARAKADLATAIAQWADDPATVSELYMCVGDESGAAAAYVRQLNDPRWRRRAMLDLSSYDAPDSRLPVDPTFARLDSVQSRPEVMAAIRAAGGPTTIHLQRDAVY